MGLTLRSADDGNPRRRALEDLREFGRQARMRETVLVRRGRAAGLSSRTIALALQVPVRHLRRRHR